MEDEKDLDVPAAEPTPTEPTEEQLADVETPEDAPSE